MSIEAIDALYLSRTPAWRSSKFTEEQAAHVQQANEKHYSRSLHAENEQAKSSQQTSARTSADDDRIV